MRTVFVFLAVFALASTSSCTRKGSEPGRGQARPSKVVNLAIWSNYVSKEVLAEFEKRTGIHVEVSNYSSNEELLAKLQAGATGYDVAVPSDYMVFAMSKLGLLRDLDKTQLNNLTLISGKYMGKAYDPENKVSVPYDWGTTGIAVNRSLYKGQINSWKNLFENPDLAGKFTLLDDVRETLGAALKSLGFSLNTKDPGELEKAKQILLRARSRVKAFSSEPLMPLVNGETAVAHAYMSDALQASRQTGGKIEYVIPEEGATIWMDNLVIPKGAQHLPEAYQFMNYLLESKSVAATVMSVLVAPTNSEAMKLLPKDLGINPLALFPPVSAMSKLEMIQDLGDSLAKWDRIWTEIKAASE